MKWYNWGTTLVFPWSYWGKPRNTSVKISGTQANILTGHHCSNEKNVTAAQICSARRKYCAMSTYICAFVLKGWKGKTDPVGDTEGGSTVAFRIASVFRKGVALLSELYIEWAFVTRQGDNIRSDDSFCHAPFICFITVLILLFSKPFRCM
jgi:hypothetical protein